MKRVILHNIRSSYNVGAIFRSADGAGVDRLYLSGYTPTPRDRFNRKQSAIAKTALGAEEVVPFTYHSDLTDLVKDLRKNSKAYIVAVELSENAKPLKEFKEPKDVVYILGNEISGVEEDVLDIVDEVVYIPMLGSKESLNVSVAASLIMYKNLI